MSPLLFYGDIRERNMETGFMIDIFSLLKWLLVPGVGGLLWLIWHFRGEGKAELQAAEARHKSEIEALQKEHAQFRERTYKRIDEAHDEVATLHTQVAAWQLEIVRTYATKSELEKVVAQILAGFEKLEARLDRLITIKSAE